MIRVSLSAVASLVGWPEGHILREKSFTTGTAKVLCCNKWWMKTSGLGNPGSHGKWHLNR